MDAPAGFAPYPEEPAVPATDEPLPAPVGATCGADEEPAEAELPADGRDTDGVEMVGVVTCTVGAGTGVGAGTETAGTVGTVTGGIVTEGVVTAGTETVGVGADGTETVGVVTDGVETVGTVSAGLEWGRIPSSG